MLLRKLASKAINNKNGLGHRRFSGSKQPLPTQTHTGKGGGRSPQPFPVGFGTGRGRWDPVVSTVSGFGGSFCFIDLPLEMVGLSYLTIILSRPRTQVSPAAQPKPPGGSPKDSRQGDTTHHLQCNHEATKTSRNGLRNGLPGKYSHVKTILNALESPATLKSA